MFVFLRISSESFVHKNVHINGYVYTVRYGIYVEKIRPMKVKFVSLSSTYVVSLGTAQKTKYIN